MMMMTMMMMMMMMGPGVIVFKLQEFKPREPFAGCSFQSSYTAFLQRQRCTACPNYFKAMFDEVRSDELRFAPNGYAYDWSDFVQYYGPEAAKGAWRSAFSVSTSLSGLRFLPDTGSMCDFHGFKEHFRKNRYRWPVYEALQRWEANVATGDAAQHVEQQSQSTQSTSIVHHVSEATAMKRQCPDSQSCTARRTRRCTLARDHKFFKQKNTEDEASLPLDATEPRLLFETGIGLTDVEQENLNVRAVGATRARRLGQHEAAQHVENKVIRQEDVPGDFLEFLEGKKRDVPWMEILNRTVKCTMRIQLWKNGFDDMHRVRIELDSSFQPGDGQRVVAQGAGHIQDKARAEASKMVLAILLLNGPDSVTLFQAHFKGSTDFIRMEAEKVRSIFLGWPGGVNWWAVQRRPHQGGEIDPKCDADDKFSSLDCSPFSAIGMCDHDAGFRPNPWPAQF